MAHERPILTAKDNKKIIIDCWSELTKNASQTSCYHFHITDDFLAKHLRLEAGDDASHARWLDVTDEESDFKNLYASHRDMVLKALQRDPQKFKTALSKLSNI